mgnify:CR=1 FL=1
MNFEGKVAVITGSSAGIGAAAAKKITSMGGRVTINYSKNKEAAEEVAHECSRLGETPLIIKADIASDEGCKHLIDIAISKFRAINVLINNAGRTKFADHSNLDALKRDDFENILALNLNSNYELIKRARPYLAINRKSSIVNISSVAGLRGLGSSVAYAASKGALNSMTLALSRSLGPDGIRVNAVCPGFVATELTARNDFAMPALISAERAAEDIILGMSKQQHEIHFPKRFSTVLKIISILPDKLQFSLLAKTLEN